MERLRCTDATAAFRKVDAAVQTALLEAARKRHPKMALAKLKAKYWYQESDGRYCYALPDDKSVRLIRLADTVLLTIKKPKTNENPFTNRDYHENRLHTREIRNVAGPYRAIWERQEGRCYSCGRPILVDLQKSDAERHLHGVLATLSRCKATSQGNSSIMVTRTIYVRLIIIHGGKNGKLQRNSLPIVTEPELAANP
ncbi:hypothetical protein [Faecalibacterium sp. An58]|uniref:hypothetical protein n=1 Tax=Faecalibacterium sp. An58 TaxID=1965648 RepID=UPI0011834D1B|nr:hypothetical protein [Faecalibacterium sp. An58]